jgi:hypothetical protein
MAGDSTTDRRGFLRRLGKWSAAAIAAVLLRESVTAVEASGWVNRRGSWVNGGGGWINRGGGGWLNSRGGGGAWVNRRG